MKLVISDKAEAIGYLAAQRLLEKIDGFVESDEQKKMTIGLSSGRTMDRVYSWVVELIRQRIEKGEMLPDFSKIQFIQTEAFYPEDPTSENSLMAGQISEKFVQPIEVLTHQKMSIYYPGTAKSVEEMEQEFTKLTDKMDLDFVTLHESGAAKGLRDADIKEGESEPKWAQGRMHTRKIQLRKLDEIRTGEDLFDSSIIREGNDKSLTDVMGQITRRISENDKSQVPTHFVTEGYKAYKNAKSVIMLTEGENKSVAVKRVLSDIRLSEMDNLKQGEVAKERKKNEEGTVSGSTVVDLRRGKEIEFYIDSQAASKIDEHALQRDGIEISHVIWEDIEHNREFGSEFSWNRK